jgi:precorrin-2 dehydrogenase/sirohydrochlorin ferrochelatase
VPHDFPILLDVSRRRVVIVGGGVVAARKAAGVLAAGGKSVRAVAVKFVREFPAEVEKKTGNFEPADLDGAELVFAATDSSVVNDEVVAEARKRGILVQRGDGEETDEREDLSGDFASPAVLRCGPIVVTVSAGGSPALAAGLRDLLAGSVTDHWVNLAEASKQIRPKIKSSGLPIARRREIFRALASGEAAAALDAGGMAALRKWLGEKFADLPDLSPSGAPASGAPAQEKK